jgi:two-component system, LytTR family, sensor kinase
MKSYDFIFSNSASHRIARYIIFWSSFLVYFFYVNLLPASTQDLFSQKTYLSSLQLMIYFPVNILAVYVAIRVLLPRYIYRGKYFSFFLVLSLLTILYFSLAFGITILFARLTRHVPYPSLPVSFRWFLPVRYGIGFPLTSTVIVCIIKLFKDFHLEQKANEVLLREKINTELQLLKTRFQPRFLYDALQHILFLIRNQSADSPSTLMKLSELLSYVLYESEKERVPLEKELEIVKTFLILKKTFYPKALKVQYHQQVQSRDLFIPPLLLLSLMENCLETLEQNENQIILMKLNIKTIDQELHFQLECVRDMGTGLEKDVFDTKIMGSIRRIELLYEGRSNVDLFHENGTTYLMMILKLNGYSSIIRKANEKPALI